MITNNAYQRSILRLSIATVIVTILAGLVYFMESGAADSGAKQLFNFTIPLFFLFAFSFSGMLIVRREPMLLWTPAAMFIAYTALFKGLGPLVNVLGNDATLAYIQGRVFSLSAHELFGTHILNLVGTLAILAGLLWGSKKLSTAGVAQIARTSAAPVRLSIKKVALFMIIVGAIIQYWWVYPYKFGLTDQTLPGAISRLGQLLTLGIAVLAYVTTQTGSKKWKLLFWVLLVTNVAISFVEFYKSIVILSVILPALGAYVGHRNLRKLSYWVVVTITLYLIASPIVTYGRLTIQARTGSIYQATITERFEILGNFIIDADSRNSTLQDDRQNGWARLSYAGQQAFAMREYQSGNTFDSISQIWIVFIPRFIWPNKPAGIGPGKRFFYYATGRENNRSSVTIYGDAYWNFGWIGLILLGLSVGYAFGRFSEYAYYWLRTDQVIYYPVLLAGIDICMRGLNSWIINGVVGRSMILIGYVIVIILISRFIKSSNRAAKIRAPRPNASISGQRPHGR